MKFIEPIKLNEIDLNEKDYLQNKVYSNQLKRLIDNYFSKKNSEPLYIGIIGDWGSGKSTVVKSAISNYKNAKIFKYDAWKYEDDSFRRTFIKEMLKQSDISKLNKEYEEIANSLYEDSSISTNSIVERIRLSRMRDKKFTGITDYIIAAIVIMAVLSTAFITINKDSTLLGVLIGLLGTIGFFNILYAETTYSHSKLFSPEQFYDKFKIILNRSKKNNNIIFIDNLDRCEGNNLILTLQSVKGFYHDKKSDFKENVLFLIPLDINSLNKAYNIEDSTHYLDKIFDNVIYLRHNNVTDKQDFINQLLKDYPDINEILTDGAKEILSCSEINTPREMIKLINLYLMQYEICISSKGKTFFEEAKNSDYLMKSIIIQRKYPKLFKWTYKDINEYIGREHLIKLSLEEFTAEYGKECYDFLNSTLNISPNDYYEFYSNQTYKSYSLPQEIEKIVDSKNTVELLKYEKKKNIVSHFMYGMDYYISNNMWKVKITSRFVVLINLIERNYFNNEEMNDIIQNWNKKVFKNNKFYDTVINEFAISFDEVYNFIIRANPSELFVKKIIDAINIGVYGDSDICKCKLYSKIFNLDKISVNEPSVSTTATEFIKMLILNNLFNEQGYLEIFDTKVGKLIEQNTIIDLINHLDFNNINTIVRIIKNNKDKTKSRNFINCIINYFNKNCRFIRDFDEMNFVYDYILNYDKDENDILTLNLEFSFDEIIASHELKHIVNKYFEENCCNETFTNYINSFKHNSNKAIIINAFDENIKNLSEEFQKEYMNFIQNLSDELIEANIQKFIKLYDFIINKRDFLNMLKNKHILALFYSKIKSAGKKEKYLNEVESVLITYDEKIDNIFLYESDPERFKKFIDSEFSLQNLVKIAKKVTKKTSKNTVTNKILELINDKDNVIEPDFSYITEFLNSDNIDKVNINKIVRAIVSKTDIEKLETLLETIDITDSRLLNYTKDKIKTEKNQ